MTESMEKRIFLVRHAKSEENERVYRLCESLTDFRRGRLFSGLRKLSSLYEWARNFTLDSPLSDLGNRQVADMRLILRSKRFWETTVSERGVILHSTLRRAKDTLYGTLPHPSARHGMIIREVDSLREATPYEHVNSKSLFRRIKEFESMLMSEEYDQYGTVIACGHSQYFMKMLNMKFRMNNVDVWEVKFVYDKTNRKDCVWGEPKLIHRSELSEAHPWDTFMNRSTPSEEEARETARQRQNHESSSRRVGNRGEDGEDGEDDEVINDLQTDGAYVRMCRICTLTEEETSNKELIRPCNCKGTQEFVHVECLNRWRATSESASEVCPVCKYKYKIRKSWLAALLLSELGATIVTILLVATLCFLSGALLGSCMPAEYLPSSVINKYLNLGKGARWWDECSPRQYIRIKKWMGLLHENRTSFTVLDYISSNFYGYSGLLLNSKALCNATVQSLMNILAEGACVITACKVLVFVYKNAAIAIENAPNDRPAVQEARMRLLNVAFLCAPLTEGSVANANSVNLRFVFILGLLLVIKELGTEFRERGRTIAASLGEVILEVR